MCINAQHALANPIYPADFTPAMKQHRKIDLTSYCTGVSRNSGPPPKAYPPGYDGFLVDNADAPRQWKGFTFDITSTYADEHLRIVSAVAEAADISPEDQLEKVAPAVLKTYFNPREWLNRPAPLLYFARRLLPGRR